jgi:shikimate dehydrogenase
VDRVALHKLAPSDQRITSAFEALPKAKLRAALIGGGIQESRTPWMHMAEGARLGLDYSYALIDFDDLGLTEAALGTVLELAAVHGLAGLNVTHPFKQSIVPHLDELSAEAAAIGAVNTVVFDAGRSQGHNTDCWGFAEAFRSGMQDAPLERVLLIGAGGAGKAVAHALCDLGALHIDIFDLDPERSANLAASLNSGPRTHRAAVAYDVAEAARFATGLVNSTPVGMARYPGLPVPRNALRPDLWVADIVYFPATTALLEAAAAAGCRTMPGRGMAVFQAVRAFELITGSRPDPQAMFRHFASAVPAHNPTPVD